jgi:hypothetical protein
MRHITDPIRIEQVKKYRIVELCLQEANREAGLFPICFCGEAECWEDCLISDIDIDNNPIFMFYYNIERNTKALGFKLKVDEKCLQRYYW